KKTAYGFSTSGFVDNPFPVFCSAASVFWRCRCTSGLILKVSGRINLSLMLPNKLHDNRHHMFAEFPSVENAVMADAGLEVVFFHIGGEARAHVLGGFGLADAGDVVEFAL